MTQIQIDDVFVDPTPCSAALLTEPEMQIEAGGLPDKTALRVVSAVISALSY